MHDVWLTGIDSRQRALVASASESQAIPLVFGNQRFGVQRRGLARKGEGKEVMNRPMGGGDEER